MPTFKKKLQVAHTTDELLSVVTDVLLYPEFLPWCRKVRLLQDAPDFQDVELELGLSNQGFGGSLVQHFSTRNRKMQDHQNKGWIVTMHLINGPFSRLDGRWEFHPAPNTTEFCILSLELNYEIRNPLLKLALGGAWGRITQSLMDAFIQRAAQVKKLRSLEIKHINSTNHKK